MICWVGLFVCGSAQARTLSVMGPLYPILERDLIELIQQKIAEKQASGELATVHERMKDASLRYVQRPPGIPLPRAQVRRESLLSPLYTLDQDLRDADGKVLFVKGTTVNPLNIKPLTKQLCFIDGDDALQVAWMMKHCRENATNKRILVAGNYQKLMNMLNTRLYFDQRGWLVKKFDIRALPARVQQQGGALYVEEIPVP